MQYLEICNNANMGKYAKIFFFKLCKKFEKYAKYANICINMQKCQTMQKIVKQTKIYKICKMMQKYAKYAKICKIMRDMGIP